MLGRFVLLLSCLAVVFGCANTTERGRALYVEGRLVDAAEVFEHGEWQLGQLDPKARVHYGLYRGATLLSLGDLDGASRWLYFAQQAENHSPGSLAPSDAQMLKVAFTDLDRRRALVRPTVDPMTGAVAGARPVAPDIAPDVVAPGEAPSATTPTPR